MYKLGDKDATIRSLPPNMMVDRKKLRAFCKVFDKHMAECTELVKKLLIWGNLENVDPKYYDALASCLDAPYYRSDYSDEKKLEIIENAVLKRAFAGTKKGMRELVRTVYPGGKFIPWYEYDGRPFHFKIIANSLSQKEVTLSVKDVKAARSVLDYVETFYEVKMKEAVASLVNAVQEVKIDCNLYGDYPAGVHEYYAGTVAGITETNISNNLFDDIKANTKENAGINTQAVMEVSVNAAD